MPPSNRFQPDDLQSFFDTVVEYASGTLLGWCRYYLGKRGRLVSFLVNGANLNNAKDPTVAFGKVVK